MAKISEIEIPSLTMDEVAAPSTPTSGNVVMYAKADGKMYSKDDAGTETLMSSGLASSTTSPPTFVDEGTSANGTGDITPGLPAGIIADDIMVLVVQSSNQAVTAPAGWTQAGPAVGIGTAAASGAVRITTFWKRHDGSETDPTVTDPGDHAIGVVFGIRGCPTSGDPFRSAGQTRKTTASTTSTGAAGATPADNCLIVQIFGTSLDSASAAFSSPTNASLSSVTEQIDISTTDGTGGGIGVITGLLATAGSFNATTSTVTSTVDVGTTLYFLPSGYVDRGTHIDRQVFTTVGFVDTWTKPSGAKQVEMIAIGGGASGSAGRNAATAAGGGGGGGGGYARAMYGAAAMPSTLAVSPGAGGAATAHADGAASNAGVNSLVSAVGPANPYLLAAGAGYAATASATGSGGAGGAGGSVSSGIAAPSPAGASNVYGSQPAPGGTGGTTAAGGSNNYDWGGGGGAGGGTSQAASSGGLTRYGGGGGGGGRSNTNVGTGGGSTVGVGNAGGTSASQAGTSSSYPELGGGGGAGGTSASGTGGTGGWPGGGGGGGGSQSGAQGGGAGGDGVVVILTYC